MHRQCEFSHKPGDGCQDVRRQDVTRQKHHASECHTSGKLSRAAEPQSITRWNSGIVDQWNMTTSRHNNVAKRQDLDIPTSHMIATAGLHGWTCMAAILDLTACEKRKACPSCSPTSPHTHAERDLRECEAKRQFKSRAKCVVRECSSNR
eukprot:888843-Rhodomonas_salina.2